jgi:hypothetical protein
MSSKTTQRSPRSTSNKTTQRSTPVKYEKRVADALNIICKLSEETISETIESVIDNYEFKSSLEEDETRTRYNKLAYTIPKLGSETDEALTRANHRSYKKKLRIPTTFTEE